MRRHGYDPVHVATAAETMVAHRAADVVFIDLDLAEFDGLTLCRELRAVSDVPMIAFASFSQLERVLALEAGCDDCVEKPYHSRELVARLGALLRRAKVLSPPVITFGELRIHPTLREVRVGDRVVETTRKEFELLHLLAAEPDRVFTRAELLRRVWGYDSVEDDVTPLASRTIDTHVSSLRRKLGAGHWIVTVRGVGFRFTDVGREDHADGGGGAPVETAGAPTPFPLSR
ncbi:response regulator transcription factor [Saccharothrix sp. S26]|uniref:response regulator transcription factor n=1 Tax=Saccharothrix sp. S26 TaxID=2907215 RepID=UPI001F2A23A6|nr:response regulator transcription factor [Saccharothrix sp. S26]MCE7000430.1 response regulator transcription factor [Saccharothrix sp. S26]